jgi:hypothetical protein
VKLETGSDGTIDFVDERSVVVELNLDGAPVLALSADAPSGLYKELEIAVDKLERGHPEEQLLIRAHPDLDNASVLVAGTVQRDGVTESFVFATDLDIDLELEFVPPLAIDVSEEPGLLVLIELDLSGWFRSPSGRLLDPADPADRSAIEGNIQNAIELFEGKNPPASNP